MRAPAAAAPEGSLAVASTFLSFRSDRGGIADPSLAVGPESIVVTTNDLVAIHSRDGARLAAAPLGQFLGPVLRAGTGVTDPRVLYDAHAQRFFITAAGGGACDPGSCAVQWFIVVSKTAAPRGFEPTDWHFYAFDGTLEAGRSTGQWGDFGVIAVDDRSLLLVGQTVAAGFAAYPKAWLFDKAPFLEGAPVAGPLAEFADFRDPVFGRRPEKALPAIGASDPGTFFLISRLQATCSVGLFGITRTETGADIRSYTVRAPGECRGPTEAPQLGGGVPLDVAPHFTSPPAYRDGFVWAVQSVLAGAAGGEVAAIRLLRIDVRSWPATPTLVEDTTFAQPGVSHFHPAIAVSDAGDVTIVMNRSSTTEYGSLYVTGRLAGDRAGSLRPPVAIKGGEARWDNVETSHEPPIRERNRFADFSHATIDPTDGSAWVVGQTVRSAREWEVWVARLDRRVAGR